MERTLTRAEREAAFVEAEATLRLEGLTPSAFFQTIKARLLNGEITTDQSIAEIDAHYAAQVREEKLKLAPGYVNA
jgi:hypothetical protein